MCISQSACIRAVQLAQAQMQYSPMKLLLSYGCDEEADWSSIAGDQSKVHVLMAEC